jgi:hypothetical protein
MKQQEAIVTHPSLTYRTAVEMPERFEIGAFIGGFMIIPTSAFAQVVFPDVGLPANRKASPWLAA